MSESVGKWSYGDFYNEVAPELLVIIDQELYDDRSMTCFRLPTGKYVIVETDLATGISKYEEY